jgi:hypothetical protein
MSEEMKSQDINLLLARLAFLENRVALLEQTGAIYGPIPNMPSPNYELIPYWQRPDYKVPKIT